MSITISADVLARLWPSAPSALRAAIVAQFDEVCTRRGIASDRARLAFMANISHESDGGTIIRESMRYSAKRIMEIFGKGRHSAAIGWTEAQMLAADARRTGGVALAERVYGLGNPAKAAELGNTKPGEGWGKRGGGLSQITGGDAYRAAGRRSGLDLDGNPDLIADPDRALDIAAADFAECSYKGKTCVEWADAGNFENCVRALNGGLNGLSSRKTWLARWTVALRDAAAAPDGDAILEVGCDGWRVGALQRRLKDLGYPVGKIDAAFGQETRKAVVAFQVDHDLALTGKVDAATQAALDHAAPREVSVARATATVADVADHPAVAAAASTATLAKRSGFLALVGAGVDGLKDDPVTAVQSGLDKVQQAKGMMGQLSELAGGVVGWIAAHPVACLSVAVAAVCALAVLRANGTVAAVVERYRAGADMG